MLSLSKLQKNAQNMLSENHTLHSFNVPHYPHTDTRVKADISGHLVKQSIIPEHTCSSSPDMEVQKNGTLVATNIWCQGSSP